MTTSSLLENNREQLTREKKGFDNHFDDEVKLKGALYPVIFPGRLISKGSSLPRFDNGPDPIYIHIDNVNGDQVIIGIERRAINKK